MLKTSINIESPKTGEDSMAVTAMNTESRAVPPHLKRLFEPIRDSIPESEWPFLAPHVDNILRLKAEKNAVILAHNYMSPDIYHCIADIVGDSLALAREAEKVDADVIVVCGVYFMAETAKLMNPTKTVIIPDPKAGCSLAEAITAADVLAMKEKYPGVPVVSYVNTTAEVKAVSDICCTSANAVDVVESLGVPRVIMTPDEYLARNTAAKTSVEIIPWAGRCEVHERFTADDIRSMREGYPDAVVLAHPECPPEVLDMADYAGSTAGMSTYVETKRPENVMLITECSMSANLAAEYPDVNFIRACHMCPHMKRINLLGVEEALEEMRYEVTIPVKIAGPARASIERMLEIKK